MTQLELPLSGGMNPAGQWLLVGSRSLPVVLAPNRRAKRYVLRLRPDGSARITIPRGGSVAEARRFAERNVPWLERQLLRHALRRQRSQEWRIGGTILFRGEAVPLEWADEAACLVGFGTETLRVNKAGADLRPEIEAHLAKLAARELPARVFELAAVHSLPVRHVVVRNQRSRWGSCSRGGTISLNWRLVLTPPRVRDYIILHELAHFRQMNHSRQFWREVGRLCPQFASAEAWLKAHDHLLR